MAFAKRSRLRKPRPRTFTVLIRPLMPSAGPLVARRTIVDDAPEMLPDHPGGLRYGFQTATRRPLEPPVPSGPVPRLGPPPTRLTLSPHGHTAIIPV